MTPDLPCTKSLLRALYILERVHLIIRMLFALCLVLIQLIGKVRTIGYLLLARKEYLGCVSVASGLFVSYLECKIQRTKNTLHETIKLLNINSWCYCSKSGVGFCTVVT